MCVAIQSLEIDSEGIVVSFSFTGECHRLTGMGNLAGFDPVRIDQVNP